MNWVSRKVGCSIRLRPELKAVLEAFAQQERRTFGNLGAVLLEWALSQLTAAGPVERLLKWEGCVKSCREALPYDHGCSDPHSVA